MLSLHYSPVLPITNISFSRKPTLSSSFLLVKDKDGPNGLAHSANPNSMLGHCLARTSNRVPPEINKEENDQNQLPGGLQPELMPKHVAVIMDGNRRWAKNRGLPVQLGHRAGGQAMKQLALNCSKFGVQVVTVFALSTENWVRPKVQDEVDFLMNLFQEVIRSDTGELMQLIRVVLRNDVRLSIIGNRSRLPRSLQNQISRCEEVAKSNEGTRLIVALNYSGRYDITQATKNIAIKVQNGVLQVEDINEILFEQHLETNGIEFPNPDLLIRTSGEWRVSNFMLWQLAYTELLFVNKLFPDFNEADLVDALTAFQRRQRRYGGHNY
ncbi:cis-prenyltransferase [Handroanthus impetiginosus]|uniref:Alkyl transferase n=1 Tax=Handroanthus impetiginosus TaxID=429701 RepID=A0A2G9HTC2_9LAMI|nr:cis-prenyltransferase [Handroanthus impetiginosus]